jgi:hypothetical protein
MQNKLTRRLRRQLKRARASVKLLYRDDEGALYDGLPSSVPALTKAQLEALQAEYKLYIEKST